jgi:hypothetical protein
MLPNTNECSLNFIASSGDIFFVADPKKAWAKPVPKPMARPMKWKASMTSLMMVGVLRCC